MKQTFLRILIFFLLGITAFGQELPPIKAFTSKDYQAGNQNWGITQDAQKNMYFANNEGLVHFDGNNWRLHPSPNKTVMRSVLAVNGRIYAGYYMEFGYWSRDANGALSYTSISESLSENLIEDEQFWSIQQVDDFILFQSLDRVYVYNTQSEATKVVNTTGIFKMFREGNTFYFQDNLLDFYELEQDQAQKSTDLPDFNSDRIVALFPSNTGSLLLSQTTGFFRLTPEGYEAWPTALDDLADDLRVYCAIQLQNGNYAVGTVADGLIILDPQGQLVSHFYQSRGLSNNTVLALMEDVDANLWAGLDNGINVLNLQAPIEIFTDANGLIGSVYATVEHQGLLYLGTNQGLFYKTVDADEPFKRIEGTNGQVWGLTVIDDSLFCAHDDGTMIIDQATARLLSDHSGTWTFLQLEDDPSKILVGNYQGLSLLDKSSGSWQFKAPLDGFKYSSRFVFADTDGAFWINHEYKGVFKLELDIDALSVRSFVRDTSLALGKNSGIVRYKDQLIYATEQGVFTKNAGQGFVKDSLLSAAYNSENEYITGQLDTDLEENLWLFGSNYIKLFGPSSFGRYIVMNNIALSSDYRNQAIGYETVSNLNSGKHILSTTSGYLLLDIDEFLPRENEVFFSSGTLTNKRGESAPLSFTESSFKPNANSLHITLNTPIYYTYLSKQFRYRLVGFRDNWSAWSESNVISYENLPAGSYTLEAQSRVGLNPSSNTASFQFEIEKQWYASNMAITLYVLFGLFLLVFINEMYRRYYRRQQLKLQRESERQLEVELLNIDKERIAMEKSNLERDMATKNQELAVATMGMARKNEVLQGIKKDLDKIDENDDGEALSRVKKIIENNLNDANDWELFKKAFNNVDKDFIKELKKKYPKLTPNDLKLCTYLRLNLSSKEIAPLLNISVRSVEISRYRLRKKMGLPTGVNLVDHILSI